MTNGAGAGAGAGAGGAAGGYTDALAASYFFSSSSFFFSSFSFLCLFSTGSLRIFSTEPATY